MLERHDKKVELWWMTIFFCSKIHLYNVKFHDCNSSSDIIFFVPKLRVNMSSSISSICSHTFGMVQVTKKVKRERQRARRDFFRSAAEVWSFFCGKLALHSTCRIAAYSLFYFSCFPIMIYQFAGVQVFGSWGRLARWLQCRLLGPSPDQLWTTKLLQGW